MNLPMKEPPLTWSQEMLNDLLRLQQATKKKMHIDGVWRDAKTLEIHMQVSTTQKMKDSWRPAGVYYFAWRKDGWRNI